MISLCCGGCYTHSLGFFRISVSFSSRESGAGVCMYSHRAARGRDIRMDSYLRQKCW